MTHRKANPQEIKEIIGAAIRRFGTKAALAEKIGVGQSQVSRVSRGALGDKSFSAETWLRFAKATGHNPSELLQLAGKAEVADLVQSLYGPVRELPARDRALLAIPDTAKLLVLALLATRVDHGKKPHVITGTATDGAHDAGEAPMVPQQSGTSDDSEIIDLAEAIIELSDKGDSSKAPAHPRRKTTDRGRARRTSR